MKEFITISVKWSSTEASNKILMIGFPMQKECGILEFRNVQKHLNPGEKNS